MLNSKIEASIMGRWQPKNIACEPVIGLLEYKDDFVELKIVSKTKVDWLEDSSSFDLFGVLEDGKVITLCDCFVNLSRRGGLPTQIFTYGVFVNYYVQGIHFDKMQRNIARALLRFDELGVWYEYRGWASKQTRKRIVLRKQPIARSRCFELCGMVVDFVTSEHGKFGGFGKSSFEHGSSLQARIRKKSLSTFREICDCCNVFEDFITVACHHLSTNFQLEIVVKKKMSGKWKFDYGYVVLRNDFHVEGKAAHPTDCITITEYSCVHNQLKFWEDRYEDNRSALYFYKRGLLAGDGVIQNRLFELAQIADSILTRIIKQKKYDSTVFKRIVGEIMNLNVEGAYPVALVSDVVAASQRCNELSFKLRLKKFVEENCDAYAYLFPDDTLPGIVNNVSRFRNDYAHATSRKATQKVYWEMILVLLFLQFTAQLLMLKLQNFSIAQVLSMLRKKWWCRRLFREIEVAVRPDSVGIFEGEEE